MFLKYMAWLLALISGISGWFSSFSIRPDRSTTWVLSFMTYNAAASYYRARSMLSIWGTLGMVLWSQTEDFDKHSRFSKLYRSFHKTNKQKPESPDVGRASSITPISLYFTSHTVSKKKRRQTDYKMRIAMKWEVWRIWRTSEANVAPETITVRSTLRKGGGG